MLSPVVKKEGGKLSWLSDSRVCVYFVLDGCQPLHARFPTGLWVFTATGLEIYRGTDKVWQQASKRLFRNQMEKLFLSRSPSISLWPRYFCSLKSLAKLGPYHSCTSKLPKSQNLGFSSLHFPPLEPGFLTNVQDIALFYQDSFATRRISSLFYFLWRLVACFLCTSFLSPVSFQRSFYFTSLCPFIHLPPFQPLCCSLNNGLHCFQTFLLVKISALMCSLASEIILGIFKERAHSYFLITVGRDIRHTNSNPTHPGWNALECIIWCITTCKVTLRTEFLSTYTFCLLGHQI